MIEEIRFKSWAHFKAQFAEHLSSEATTEDYVYRGQRESSWKLGTSFSRDFIRGGMSAEEIWELHKQSIVHFVEEVGLFHKTLALPDIKNSLLAFGKAFPARVPWTNVKSARRATKADSELLKECVKVWSYGQHHGLPTPLLDWSSSPYIAAFFAYESAFNNKKNLSRKEIDASNDYVAVFALRKAPAHIEKIWDAMRVKLLKPPPMVDNTRIKNQRGLFSMSPLDVNYLDDYVVDYCRKLKMSTNTVLLKFGLPYRSMIEAIKDLESMDINPRRIYDDWSGVCSAANMKTLVARKV
jgi:hypothetical protein